jgi:hypothetical protein
MLLDSYMDVDLVQSAETSFGMPVFMVIDNKPRKPKIKFFRGETAYQDSQRYWNDIVVSRVYK